MYLRVTPIKLSKQIVLVITLVRTEFVLPEALSFSVYDDALVASLSSQGLCVLQLHRLHLPLQRLNLYQLSLTKKRCQWLIQKLV